MEAVAFQRITASVKDLAPSKWFLDSRYMAAKLGITTETFDSFLVLIDEGGALVDGDWESNPEPYDARIDLDQIDEDNILGLQCLDYIGRKANPRVQAATEPSAEVVGHPARYCRRFSRDADKKLLNFLTHKVQREIVLWVIGEHQTLQTGDAKEIGEDRRKTWRAWVASGQADNIYHHRHLPWIVNKYYSLWDVAVDPKMPPKDIPLPVLDQCRREIIQMMVGMFVLPQSALDNIAERRSRRHFSAVSEEEGEDSDAAADTDAAAANKRARTRSRPVVETVDEDEEDGESDDESVENSLALGAEGGLPLGAEFQPDVILQLFHLTNLKTLWMSGLDGQKEVGRREIAYKAAGGTEPLPSSGLL